LGQVLLTLLEMLVNNIFNLVNKFGTAEDQLSAGFGFILKNHPKVLMALLKKLGLPIDKKIIKITDIETQVVYESGNSRIDIQLNCPGNFLVFIESKVGAVRPNDMVNQLKKYKDILVSRRSEYPEGIRLVYVGKYKISENDTKYIAGQLRMKGGEFLYLSWEDLIKLTDMVREKEIIKLFHDYISDSMYNKKIIGEQKIKNVVEVLVMFTNPTFWEMTKVKNIAVQKNSAPDAKYVAFLRTHLPDRKRSAITHIAEVEYTEINVPREKMLEGLPQNIKNELVKHMKDRGVDLDAGHKNYVLKKDSIVALAREIEHVGNAGMVNFRTTMSELLRAKSTKEMKKGRQT